MGRKQNGNKPPNKNNNDPQSKPPTKRRVSFDLSQETNDKNKNKKTRCSYTSVASANNTPRLRPKQTWFQTFLLSFALLFTLSKLIYRATHVYCYKNGQLECNDSFIKERLCKSAVFFIDVHETVPYSHFFLGINNDKGGKSRDVNAGWTEEATQLSKVNDESSNKGILKKVIDGHRRKKEEKRKKKKQKEGKESLDRQHHPLHRLLEGASTFAHWKKTKKQEHEKQQQMETKINATVEVDWSKWKYAMSDDYQLTSTQIGLIQELSKRVLMLYKAKQNNAITEEESTYDANKSKKQSLSVKTFSERVDNVPWGGVYNQEYTKWWPRKDGKNGNSNNKVSSMSDGARLLAAYLKIMKWPKDLYVKFPFKLCAKGCDSEVAVLHTLEWREKYLPWCTSPKAIQHNSVGYIYHRGHSRAGPQQRLEADNTKETTYLNNAGHTMVWYSPGKASIDDIELYIRSLIYTLEAAVADSLLRNKGEIGRFNLVLDCDGVGSKTMPRIAHVKKLFAFLQDHFPDRLGVLLLVNLSGVVRMIMNMVLPFVTEDVKAKIHVVPEDKEKREEMLTQFIDLEHVPIKMGGKDNYVFNANQYYYGGSGECVVTEEKIREYITTMPYHA